jgi:gentisate 1,2-dioxygenase
MRMDGSTQGDLAGTATLEELYPKLAAIEMGAGWNKKTPSLWPSPGAIFRPFQWRYDQAKGALDAAGRLIDTALAERRNLILANPIAGNTYATASTTVVAYQMIMPGEQARSHRHTPNALRLILDAEAGAYTVVDGVRLAMLPGDVVLTPNWSWHGHGNDGGAPAYWLDFLDVPFVHLLNPMFFEPYPGDFQDGTDLAGDSPLLFRWRDTERRLDEAAGGRNGAHAVEVKLGDPALDTLALSMIRLTPGGATAPVRSTANNVYACVSGEGETTIGDARFTWRHGDVVVAPAWERHHHRSSEGAVLFRVSDEPIMTKLGFFRSE